MSPHDERSRGLARADASSLQQIADVELQRATGAMKALAPGSWENIDDRRGFWRTTWSRAMIAFPGMPRSSSSVVFPCENPAGYGLSADAGFHDVRKR